ncbi:MAG: hypothetical protein IT323_10510 [Anaerolineae bacterium]|nr:hypothetical protein [Anaerolineae bacterium]
MTQLFRRLKLGAGLIALLLVVPLVVRAQQPVAYGLFFYSPSCPHCHEVINNHWPAIEAEFGERLQVLFIDVTQPEGVALMRATIRELDISSNGVPMLILGTEVLVGSMDIPGRAPGMIRAGLEAGGIPMPPIPGIESLFASVVPQPSPSPSTESTYTDAVAAPTRSVFDDPANVIAVVTLVGGALSLAMVMTAALGAIAWRDAALLGMLSGRLGRVIQFLAVLLGAVLTASLLLGSAGNVLVGSVAAIVFLIFLTLAIVMIRRQSARQVPDWFFPLTALAGLFVAGYLAYVEVTLSEAVCGIVGDCNTVQQSPYARLWGIPIGVIGIAGYASMLLLSINYRVSRQSWLAMALFAMALVGVGFSTYLTFLEPFVIGASCVWCLTSTVLMILLLWMTVPAAWHTARALLGPRHPQEKLA